MARTSMAIIAGLTAVSGLKNGLGFFTVGRDANNVWWFKEPSGANFFAKSVTSVNRGGLMEGRIGPYYNSTVARYGTSNETFRMAVSSRLAHWNFNSLGAWATSEFWVEPAAPNALPFTIDVEATYGAPLTTLVNGSNMPDVFDPAWLAYLDSRAAALCAPHAQSQGLLGYFTDNELNWPHFTDVEKSLPPTAAPVNFTVHGPGLLQLSLSQDPAKPIGVAAWSWVLGRYNGSLSSLSTAWQLPQALQSQGDMAALYTSQMLTIASAQLQADDADWQSVYASGYFERTADAIKKYDGNHLILGVKYGGPASNEVYTANAKYHDVVSLDNYRYNMSARVQAVAAATNHAAPILVAEFSWIGSGCPVQPADPSGITELECCEPDADPSVGGFPCPVPGETPATNMTNMDRMYCNGGFALASTFAVPEVVGWTWYRWVDEGSLGQVPSPFSELGLVDLWDRVKADAAVYLAPLNAAAEAIHAAGDPAVAFPHLHKAGASTHSANADPAAWMTHCPVF